MDVQIKVALHSLRNVANLPMPKNQEMPDFPIRNMATDGRKDKTIIDILDWLSSIFGFQVQLHCKHHSLEVTNISISGIMLFTVTSCLADSELGNMLYLISSK